MPQQILHTERITLVPLADRHLEWEAELDSDPDVMRPGEHLARRSNQAMQRGWHCADRDGSHGSTLEDPVIGKIAKAHRKSAAQVMLRWHLQEGRAVIPSRPSRTASLRTLTSSTSS
jgi:hypothetical protein